MMTSGKSFKGKASTAISIRAVEAFRKELFVLSFNKRALIASGNKTLGQPSMILITIV
jgi:hypothetical protein